MRVAPLAILIALSPVARAADDPKAIDFFEKKIRPVLVEHCYKCHSAETNKSKGGLVVDTRQGLREGGETGPAVVPGNPANSVLIKALKHDGLKMPNGQTKLPDAVLADFEAWIKLGAADPRDGKSTAKKGIDYAEGRKHWAYQPVKAAAIPAVKDQAWPRNDIDRHVLAKIEARGLKPAADAPLHTLLRRLTYDLTGLPPTPEELAAFENQAQANPQAAIEAAVERLLQSPRFGEHWARHWLDGVRFNATLNTAERYRDWVVAALNADLPYDQFILHQLAGDLLPASGDPRRDDAQLIATQMLCMNAKEMDSVEGSIEVIGQHLLGVSINCAKCHDHKFDVYSQADYYALAGILTSTKMEGYARDNPKGVELKSEPGAYTFALAESKAADTNLLIRGEKNQKGPIIERRFPLVLAGDQQTPLARRTTGSGRLELAQWIANPQHPLTSRVMANRVWQRLAGRPIVGTPNDFGPNGEAPVHPELLDHLAHRFGGDLKWSVKKLVQEIVLSRTYRQSAANPAALAADPENKLFTRAQVRRLTYEQTVDALNSVAGVLTFEAPVRGKGPAQYPRFAGKEVATAYRGLYHDDDALRNLFDGADPELLTETRDESVTAPQMLFFLNNPQVLLLAGKVAARAKAVPGDEVAAAYRLLYGRPPSDREKMRATAYLKTNSLDRLCHVLLMSSEFSYLE